ncbi:hypothetical protein NA56DRAFT_173388 [Hyaloscypha hepaticicola]|uniref:Uncharacterized protein n=1 Tax=Hyaloscypha hepaticicola TaxID=2082293 RepID=A0A2J6Q368_9HELO|nr:hypothetical protein NA56DRAFT_173388 [Hyaloscypha hepaticicola]
MILKSTEIPSSSLDNQMRLIKMLNDESIFRDGNFSRFQLQGNLGMTVLPENYREFQEMDNVRRVYEREIKDISAILGELHPITLTLKSTYCSVLWSEGCWQRCEDIGLETLQGCTKLYGEFHRKTLQSKEDLVSFLAS